MPAAPVVRPADHPASPTPANESARRSSTARSASRGSTPEPDSTPDQESAPEHARREDLALWTLGDGLKSAGMARGYARSALIAWGLDDLVDSIAVSVSEMVANAMCHSRCPTEHPSAHRVLLSLVRQQHGVLCVVVDSGTRPPAVREPDDWAESGRGLHIVECLSDEWGWTPPDAGGKAVWASFSPLPDEEAEAAAAVAGGLVPSQAPSHCPYARREALARVLRLARMLSGAAPA